MLAVRKASKWEVRLGSADGPLLIAPAERDMGAARQLLRRKISQVPEAGPRFLRCAGVERVVFCQRQIAE